MSFILDALKKSETERQRQNGPALFEAKVAARRHGLPGWAVALGVLLAINVGVIGWLLLRHPSRSEANAAPVVAPPQTPPQSASAPVTTPPPAIAQAPPSATTLSPATDDTAVADSNAESADPDDYQPATEPAAGPVAQAGDSHVTRTTEEGLPTYEQVAGTAGLPDLRLDLHVYAEKPAGRFVLINMHRLREGDSTPEGVRVESISNHGAVLSFRGTRFVLERE